VCSPSCSDGVATQTPRSLPPQPTPAAVKTRNRIWVAACSTPARCSGATLTISAEPLPTIAGRRTAACGRRRPLARRSGEKTSSVAYEVGQGPHLRCQSPQPSGRRRTFSASATSRRDDLQDAEILSARTPLAKPGARPFAAAGVGPCVARHESGSKLSGSPVLCGRFVGGLSTFDLLWCVVVHRLLVAPAAQSWRTGAQHAQAPQDGPEPPVRRDEAATRRRGLNHRFAGHSSLSVRASASPSSRAAPPLFARCWPTVKSSPPCKRPSGAPPLLSSRGCERNAEAVRPAVLA
jgi:hypothetical protein